MGLLTQLHDMAPRVTPILGAEITRGLAMYVHRPDRMAYR